ncbi:MAG: hypothetical protein UU95_C0019G0009 [Parcubacteria group bacterium GW2011_GWC2_42_12]|uniref:Uncharacterized protein n=1 Tax=Candidatus Falkowbacteria bacterium RIFCSPHIGHO2_02_FULL_42_9 TaxID=1797986 RepID=A0A1F5S6D3_9BACT|nr:MAG: hypothetical protein UU95_C0019G0009 [Parcubacteria group bacterium GW2011_GWC2_42_12]OGF22254.1 MAG: hypothetical protein A3D45_00695 [Candidatus Falkowbacteria bacterium RIFCSPHIGHO2_02_FULL_42_9]
MVIFKCYFMPKRRRKNSEVRSKKLELKILSARKDKKNEEISQAQADNINEVEFDNEKVERDKQLFMWIGISCLMVIFFVVWIFSLKYEFKASFSKTANSGFNWSQTKVELDKAMTQVKQGLAEIKKIQDSSSQNANEPKLSQEQIDLLKGKLLNEIATGTASSTIK